MSKATSARTILLHPKTYGVAAVTVANGGDNIGIYTPLFASLYLLDLMITIIIFLSLVAVWCLIAVRLTYQQHVARILSRYEYLIVPFVLTGLGIYIIIKNGTLRLIGL